MGISIMLKFQGHPMHSIYQNFDNIKLLFSKIEYFFSHYSGQDLSALSIWQYKFWQYKFNQNNNSQLKLFLFYKHIYST